MTKLQKEALDAVEKINDEIIDKWTKKKKDFDYIPQLSIIMSMESFFIGLTVPSDIGMDIPEFHIYNSFVTDDRIYYEKSDKYETFYKYIRRKFNLIKEEINKIKI